MKSLTLKVRVYIFALVCVGLIFTAGLRGKGKLSEADLAQLRAARTVQLVLEPPTGSGKHVKFPVRETVSKLLAPAGLRLTASQGDMVFKIKLRATANSRMYSSFGRGGAQRGYTGASVSGNIYVSIAEKQLIKKYFSGRVSPRSSILKGSFTKPSSAPFGKAFSNSSLRQKVMEILSEIKENPSLLLISYLKNNAWQVRKNAVSLLGDKKGPGVTGALKSMLKDPKAEVRRETAYALGKTRDPACIQPLLAALTDKDKKMRKAAVAALAKLDRNWRELESAKNMAPTWIATLKDNDSGKRLGAVEALIEVYDQRALKPLIMAMMDGYSARGKIVKFLGKKHPGWKKSPEAEEAVSYFLKSLPVLKRFKKQDAIKALGEIGSPRALNPLINIMNVNDGGIRSSALTVLNKNYPDWGDTDAAAKLVPRLIRDMKTGRGNAKFEAARVLREIDDPRVVTVFIGALKDRNWRLRKLAIDVLGNSGDPRVVKPLIRLLKSTDKSTRRYAADALGNLDRPEVVKPLIDALKDKDASVRIRAIKALGKKDDARVNEPLLAALQEENTSVIRAAIGALAERKEPRAFKPIMELAKHKNSMVKKDANNALKKLMEVCPASELTGLLSSSDYRLRESAVKAMAKHYSSEAVESLILALKDTNSTVRLMAVEGLAAFDDPKVVDPLIAALKDDYYKVNVTAAKALGRRKEPRAVEPLLELVKRKPPKITSSNRYSRRRISSSSKAAKIAAFDALENMLELIPVQTLMDLHKTIDYKYKSKVWKLLINTKDPAATDVFIATLKSKDASLRRTMMGILGGRKERRAIGPIIERLKSRDRSEKRKAAHTLRVITGQNFGEKYKKWKKWWKKNK
jgi:HEAT repeat protein